MPTSSFTHASRADLVRYWEQTSVAGRFRSLQNVGVDMVLAHHVPTFVARGEAMH